jgi:thiol:disulfide interchange protein DsbC
MRKNILILSLVLTSFCILPLSAYGVEKNGHECIKCHKLSDSDAKNIIKDAFPDAKIIDVRPAPVKGLWEVAFEARGRKDIIYVDSSRELLIAGGIYKIKTKTSLTGERLQELNRIDLAQIPLDEAILMGNKNAPKKVIVFTDPD